jgi:hypothetical protein
MPLVTRQSKGSPLSFEEMDGNLTYLQSLAGSGNAGPFETGSACYSIQPKTGLNSAGSSCSTVLGGYKNTISTSGGGSCGCCGPIPIGYTSYGATIGGGINNTISGSYGTIAGGQSNSIGAGACSGIGATVGGGVQNAAASPGATVSGGGFQFCQFNIASGVNSTIGGGTKHTASGTYSTIGGGDTNQASGLHSTVSGGRFNCASQCATVAGGSSNAATATYSSIAGGQFNTITSSANGSFIGGGQYNATCQQFTGILGGINNSVVHCHSMIVGSCIVTDRICTTFVNNLSIKNIPLSSVGLPPGSVWNDGGTLKIV